MGPMPEQPAHRRRPWHDWQLRRSRREREEASPQPDGGGDSRTEGGGAVVGKRPENLLKKRAYRGMSLEEAQAAEAAHRRRMRMLLALFMTQFFGMLSNTIIGNVMPVIVAEIGGTQGQYAWVMTSGILANTITTPIAGKFADLLNKKYVYTFGIGIFMLGSMLCGIAWSPESLIAFRVLQGIGMGVQVTLSQVIMATVVPPRERGRYNGYMGAIFAVATVSGPLVGGLIVDIPFLGWRWTYWIVIPFMAIALFTVQRRLVMTRDLGRKVSVDYLGAMLISTSATVLLLWMSMVGRQFEWISWQSGAMLGAVAVLMVAFGFVEAAALEPLIPLDILLGRTTILAIAANIGLGTAMFGSNVYLGQYFQYGLGYSPAVAGLLGLPMIFGIVAASTLTGQWITRHGRWKRYVVAGMILLTVSFGLAWFVGAETPVIVMLFLLLLGGLGLGAANMNVILAVQNSVGLANMGAATSAVMFFRNLFGAVGIQLMGLVYGLSVEGAVTKRLGPVAAEELASASSSLNIDALGGSTEVAVRAAYADAIGPTFGLIGVMCALGLVAVLAMPATRLRDTVDTAGPGE